MLIYKDILALCTLTSSTLQKVSDSSTVSNNYLIALCNWDWTWIQHTLGGF